MIVYLAIIIALSLACVAGMQFFYLMFLQTANRQDKRRIRELEEKLRRTHMELDATRRELDDARQQLDEPRERDETWPEIIDG